MPKTYNDIYFTVRNELRLLGVEAFAQEARILLASASGKSTNQLMRDMYLYTSDDIEAKALDMLNRRKNGEPLAYITGEWEFYGLPMKVTRDVLIPRMDTEIIVDAAIESIKKREMTARVLDLCCGSGCIACAVAKEVPPTRVVAIDKNAAALDVCRQNIRLNSLPSRVIPMQADASIWPPAGVGSFDIILSNPPYIPSEEIETLDKSVKSFEPLIALDGGNDGLDFYRSIIKYWTICLRPGGEIMFEVGEGQAEAVKNMLLKAGYLSVSTRLDTLGIERVVIGQWKKEF